jgi:hypothetical protein
MSFGQVECLTVDTGGVLLVTLAWTDGSAGAEAKEMRKEQAEPHLHAPRRQSVFDIAGRLLDEIAGPNDDDEGEGGGEEGGGGVTQGAGTELDGRKGSFLENALSAVQEAVMGEEVDGEGKEEGKEERGERGVWEEKEEKEGGSGNGNGGAVREGSGGEGASLGSRRQSRDHAGDGSDGGRLGRVRVSNETGKPVRRKSLWKLALGGLRGGADEDDQGEDEETADGVVTVRSSHDEAEHAYYPSIQRTPAAVEGEGAFVKEGDGGAARRTSASASASARRTWTSRRPVREMEAAPREQEQERDDAWGSRSSSVDDDDSLNLFG